MAAYVALLSLAQTTVAIRNQERDHLSIEVEEEIRSIYEYMTLMLSFFEDFPENVKALELEGRIRDIAHEIEDIIENFMWESKLIRTEPPSMDLEYQLEYLEGRYPMGTQMLWRFLRRRPPSLNLGKLRGATREICQMMEELPAYLPPGAADSSPSTPASNGAVIGLEEDLMAIKELLCGSPSQLHVHPIVGMVGIGKTTLAMTIYEDPLILEHFDICVWVVVSQDYTPHRLTKNLLGLLDSMNLLEERPSRENIDEFEAGVEVVHENLEKQLVREKIEEPAVMATKIYQDLKGRRYLIVMDDVWRTEVLDDGRNVFPDDNNGSRIMLTTRLLTLVAYIDPYSPLHEMKFMDDSQSWNLFKKKVFGNRICPHELEEVGKEIVRRCAGLPLAVVLVAGVLSSVNTTRASWEEVARNVNPVVKWDLEEILSLSYAHLPHHLRPCFLYMGGFPEDESIHASILIKLWVAEGFLSGHGKSLEEEAEEYLEDLVKRNLVIVNNRKSDGKIKSCSLHDIVRELCIWKAHQEKFLYVVDGCDLEPGPMIGGRRISCNHSNLSDVQGPNLRTVLCFQYQSTPSWPAFLGSSTLIKVLNVVPSNYKELSLLPRIIQLFHLRHLALIGSFSVPSTISNLVNLQTLMEGQKSQTKLTRTNSSLLRSSPTIRSSIHSLSSVSEIAPDSETEDLEEQKPHSRSVRRRSGPFRLAWLRWSPCSSSRSTRSTPSSLGTTSPLRKICCNEYARRLGFSSKTHSKPVMGVECTMGISTKVSFIRERAMGVECTITLKGMKGIELMGNMMAIRLWHRELG